MAGDEFEMIEKKAPGSNIRVQQEKTDHTNIAMPNMDEEEELQHLSPNGPAGGQEEEPDHTDQGMSNMGEEEKLQGSPANGYAGGQEEQAGCFSRTLSFCNKNKKAIIIIGFVISNLIAGVVGYFLATRKTDDYKLLPAPSQHGKRPCPSDWFGYQGKCFFFSDEERNWTAAQDFCSLYNASLAIIEKKDLHFLQRYIGSTPHWIGFIRDPGQAWKWINGNVSTWEVLGDGGNCAFLNDEGGASSSMCHTHHHWICSKPDEFTRPEID